MLEGPALRNGQLARVTLLGRPGPIVVRVGGREGRLWEGLHVVSSDRATTVASTDGRLQLRMVEHLFAALAAAGAYDGVAIECDGSELPLLDGGARAWCDALATLNVPRQAPRLRVCRDAVVEVGLSRYEFACASGVRVRVAIDFGDARLERTAEWRGDPLDFVTRIAPARTFAFTKDLGELEERHLVAHVAPESVVVVAPDQIHAKGVPFVADEPARHKLLDLMGDLYAWGGPPLGSVAAHRPGHAANHEAIERALADEVLVKADTEGLPRTP